VGCISDSQSLIYLDPHKKHAKVTRESFDNQKHTFFCDQMKWLHIDNVNPEMILAFYLKDLNDLARIVKKFASFKDNSPVGINRK
jgi:radical SAM superfamily enzyme with C-terminal helix-hairpin-helix motif